MSSSGWAGGRLSGGVVVGVVGRFVWCCRGDSRWVCCGDFGGFGDGSSVGLVNSTFGGRSDYGGVAGIIGSIRHNGSGSDRVVSGIVDFPLDLSELSDVCAFRITHRVSDSIWLCWKSGRIGVLMERSVAGRTRCCEIYATFLGLLEVINVSCVNDTVRQLNEESCMMRRRVKTACFSDSCVLRDSMSPVKKGFKGNRT